MEMVGKLCENQQCADNENNSEQAVPNNLNRKMKCERDELKKQNELLLSSATDLLKAISNLNEGHDIAMTTINQLQEQLEKIKQTALI